jgi:excisionase family DNA binding protein
MDSGRGNMTMENTGKKLYRLKEVEAVVGLGTKTLGKWIREGKVKGIRMGRLWYMTEEEVQRILKEGV